MPVGLLRPVVGADAVVRETAVVEHAVRHLLVADALAFSVAMPPPAVPAPLARSSEVPLALLLLPLYPTAASHSHPCMHIPGLVCGCVKPAIHVYGADQERCSTGSRCGNES